MRRGLQAVAAAIMLAAATGAIAEQKIAHWVDADGNTMNPQPTKEHWTMVAETWYGAEELEKSLVAFEKAGRAAADGDIDAEERLEIAVEGGEPLGREQALGRHAHSALIPI